MEADVLIHTTFPYHFLQRLADGPIVQVGEHEVVFLERSVTLYYLQGNVQQFHLERYARLMPFGDNPLLAVHFHDAVVGQFLDVHERKGGEVRKHEQATDVRQLRVCELVRRLLPLARLPFASQSSFAMLRLQLNCATVPLIVTRPMIGTIPFFS